VCDGPSLETKHLPAAHVDGLPDAAKEYIYRRLWEILNAKDLEAKFAHLPRQDRSAIQDILRATKPDLRAGWATLDGKEGSR
jgi:hypothetical protein